MEMTGIEGQQYLARERAKMQEAKQVDVQFESVSLRNSAGPAVRFRPGEKVWVDVKFRANRASPRVAVVFDVLDQKLGEIFNTSSERLGHPPVDLAAGQSCTMTFELDLHLANGTFHIGGYLYRYDLEREYDRVIPAATFFVESDADVRGGANLYPRVVSTDVS